MKNTMRLDLYVKMVIEQDLHRDSYIQKFLDALKILDRATYDQILDDGACSVRGTVYWVTKDGKVK